MPFGEVRAEVGTISQTDFGYTGQRSISMLSIMDYNARFYDPGIGRFIQPDTIIPNPADPQSWNRYAYTQNNPVRYIDPSGHLRIEEECGMNGEDCGERVPAYTWNSPENKIDDRDDGNVIGTRKKSRNRSNGTNDEIEDILRFGKKIYKFLNTYEDDINFGKPMYKQLRYVFPTGPVESVLGAALQGYENRYQDLTIAQRISRILIVGFEVYTEDRISNLGGAAGFGAGEVVVPAGGGSVGFFIGTYATSKTIDNTFSHGINPWLFPKLGLGDYPGTVESPEY